jgi:hypothetical protein
MYSAAQSNMVFTIGSATIKTLSITIADGWPNRDKTQPSASVFTVTTDGDGWPTGSERTDEHDETVTNCYVAVMDSGGWPTGKE